MSNPYPHLDSSENRSSGNQGYQYIEPAKSNHASLDCNQGSLKENLLPAPHQETQSTLNKAPFIIIFIELLVEIIVSQLVYKRLYVFEFCYWEFSFYRYSESAFNHADLPYSGNLGNFYRKLGCEEQDFANCPGVCGLVSNFMNSRDWLFYAAILRYLLSVAALVWMALETFAKKYGKAKKVFGIFHVIAAVCLITGTAACFLGIQEWNLKDPAQLNDSDDPEEFEWKTGFYLIVILPVWMVGMNIIAYLNLKD
jgi:hypothetical protein